VFTDRWLGPQPPTPDKARNETMQPH